MIHDRSADGAQACSAPWCIDGDTRDNVRARRNVLTALWAGRLLNLDGPDLTAYAVAVHLADHEVAGDADVVDKIAGDLRRGGVTTTEAAVRDRLGRAHREALVQLASTD